jgi:hypothetical protein
MAEIFLYPGGGFFHRQLQFSTGFCRLLEDDLPFLLGDRRDGVGVIMGDSLGNQVFQPGDVEIKLIDEDGEFDLLGDTYRDYLRFKLAETFKHCPELDGVVLTLTEADYSVIHNSNPKMNLFLFFTL